MNKKNYVIDNGKEGGDLDFFIILTRNIFININRIRILIDL